MPELRPIGQRAAEAAPDELELSLEVVRETLLDVSMFVLTCE